LKGIGRRKKDNIKEKIGGHFCDPDAGFIEKIPQNNINEDG
jgi:hypothetical protein